jgi:hypothetical protein
MLRTSGGILAKAEEVIALIEFALTEIACTLNLQNRSDARDE